MDNGEIELGSLDLDASPPKPDFGEMFSNMVGDAELGGGNGHIEIDRTIPHHPVIRFIDRSDEDGGGEGDDPDDPDNPDDPDAPGGGDGGDGDKTCVTTVNSQDGDLSIIGGKGIRVATNGKTIIITADADKEKEDDDPNEEEKNDCGHPDGGYSAESERDDNESGGFGGGGGYNAGGVEGDNNEHTADPCNHDC